MLGVSKDKIKVNAYDYKVEVKSEDLQREYHRTEIPLETAKSAYNNGILEITFSKKERVRGKAIKVEEPLTSFIASCLSLLNMLYYLITWLDSIAQFIELHLIYLI